MDYEKMYKEAVIKMRLFFKKYNGLVISENGTMYKDLIEIFPDIARLENGQLMEFLADFAKKEPKFKIGDTIIHVDDGADIIYKEHKVINVLDLGYILDNGHSVEIADQDDWLVVRRCSVDEAMAEVEEKAKAFTEAHKGEDSEKILAEMRGEMLVSDGLKKAANTYMNEEIDNGADYVDEDGDYYFYATSLEYAFKAGAKWQKQQMMEEAVDVRIRYINSDICAFSKEFTKYMDGVRGGSKVKMIIIKEE